MKNLPDEDEPLHALLSAPLPPLPGDAFTARVLSALPPARRRSPVSPLWWGLTGGVTGLVFAFTHGASWSALADGGDALVHAFTPVLALALDPWLTLALTATALSLLLSFAINRQLTARFY